MAKLYMAKDQVLSGWTMQTVPDLSQTLGSVNTVAGDLTTVTTMRMCPSVVRQIVRTFSSIIYTNYTYRAWENVTSYVYSYDILNCTVFVSIIKNMERYYNKK